MRNINVEEFIQLTRRGQHLITSENGIGTRHEAQCLLGLWHGVPACR